MYLYLYIYITHNRAHTTTHTTTHTVTHTKTHTTTHTYTRWHTHTLWQTHTPLHTITLTQTRWHKADTFVKIQLYYFVNLWSCDFVNCESLCLYFYNFLHLNTHILTQWNTHAWTNNTQMRKHILCFIACKCMS